MYYTLLSMFVHDKLFAYIFQRSVMW